MKINIILTTLFIGIAHSLFAYPISPRPLRKLVMESEYIVYADVVRIVTTESDDYWNSTQAVLVIKELVLGEITVDTINVFFSPGMICPAPAHYEAGTTVLAFVDKNEDGYHTHALSYGVKTIDAIGFEVYKSRIVEMQKILLIKDEKEKAEKTIDWLITCAIEPSTRWEGIYELSPHSDFMSFYDRDTVIIMHELDNNQIMQLRSAFFESVNLTYADMGLIDLIAKKDDTELVQFLIKILKKLDLADIWYKEFLMSRIAEFSDRNDLRKIVKQIEALDYMDEEREEKADQLGKSFIEKL